MINIPLIEDTKGNHTSYKATVRPKGCPSFEPFELTAALDTANGNWVVNSSTERFFKTLDEARRYIDNFFEPASIWQVTWPGFIGNEDHKSRFTTEQEARDFYNKLIVNPRLEKMWRHIKVEQISGEQP